MFYRPTHEGFLPFDGPDTRKIRLSNETGPVNLPWFTQPIGNFSIFHHDGDVLYFHNYALIVAVNTVSGETLGAWSTVSTNAELLDLPYYLTAVTFGGGRLHYVATKGIFTDSGKVYAGSVEL